MKTALKTSWPGLKLCCNSATNNICERQLSTVSMASKSREYLRSLHSARKTEKEHIRCSCRLQTLQGEVSVNQADDVLNEKARQRGAASGNNPLWNQTTGWSNCPSIIFNLILHVNVARQRGATFFSLFSLCPTLKVFFKPFQGCSIEESFWVLSISRKSVINGIMPLYYSDFM